MSNDVGRIWVGVAVVATAVVVFVGGDGFRGRTPAEDALTGALTQLGILYVLAIFVERGLEVFIKAWRRAGRSELERELNVLEEGSEAEKEKRREIDRYREGTRRRALLTGLAIGVVLALAGVRTLAVMFDDGAASWFQGFLFQFADVLVTAGLIAGGSSAVHEVMSLITGFLGVRKKGLAG